MKRKSKEDLAPRIWEFGIILVFISVGLFVSFFSYLSIFPGSHTGVDPSIITRDTQGVYTELNYFQHVMRGSLSVKVLVGLAFILVPLAYVVARYEARIAVIVFMSLVITFSVLLLLHGLIQLGIV